MKLYKRNRKRRNLKSKRKREVKRIKKQNEIENVHWWRCWLKRKIEV